MSQRVSRVNGDFRISYNRFIFTAEVCEKTSVPWGFNPSPMCISDIPSLFHFQSLPVDDHRQFQSAKDLYLKLVKLALMLTLLPCNR